MTVNGETPEAPRATSARRGAMIAAAVAAGALIAHTAAMKSPAWRTYGAAFLAGVAAALAMPPLFWLPLGVVGIVVLVRQWDSAPTPRIEQA